MAPTQAGVGGDPAGGVGGAGTGGQSFPEGGTGVNVDTSLEPCGEPGLPVFAACGEITSMDEDAGSSPVSSATPVAFELDARVDAVVHDGFDCGGEGLGGGSNASFYALELSDGQQSVRLRLGLPLDHDLAEVGDALHVSFEAGRWGAFHEGPPPEGSLEIRDANGVLLLWMSQSIHGPTGLKAPEEVIVADGLMRCRGSSTPGCTFSSTFVGMGERQAEVPRRASADLGDYIAINQENDAQCFGDFKSMQVAVIRK